MRLSLRFMPRTRESGIGVLSILLLLFVLSLLAFFLLRSSGPCSKTLTYRIGTVDDRFGLSREEFAFLVRKAASVWEAPVSRELFREEPDGRIVVHLVYDYRQQSSERLQDLQDAIQDKRDAYDELHARHMILKQEYDRQRDRINRDYEAYRARVSAFNEENRAASVRGGLSQTRYRHLQEERDSLTVFHNELQTREDELRETAETLNSLVAAIDEIAAEHNENMDHYRDEGDILGGEFSKGHYARQGLKETITIYQFQGREALLRVLVHELGHALGLGHVEDPHAVMYRLVRDEGGYDLAPADIDALKALCERK